MRILLTTVILMAASLTSSTSSGGEKWAIALHGGAGRISKGLSEERVAMYERSLNKALAAGVKILEAGGSSINAVEATVRVMEDDPLFNAGRGAVFTSAGTHELDAAIMDGSTKACGAVAGVTRIKNPIAAARHVMEETPHVLLLGEGAEAFAEKAGCETVDPSTFFTPRRWQSLRQLRPDAPVEPAYKVPTQMMDEFGRTPEEQRAPKDMEEAGGTVGCVAVDSPGRLAAATSTGGLTGKMPGRVGDTPIIGAGTYADDRVAVSGTGQGEQYIRHQIAARVAWLESQDETTVDDAVQECLDSVLDPGDGGIIAIDRDGAMSLRTSTGAMPRAWATAGGERGTAIWE